MSYRTIRNCVMFTVAAVITTATTLAEPAAWPGLRGPDKDGTVNGRLIDGDTAGLTVGWKRELGSGYV